MGRCYNILVIFFQLSVKLMHTLVSDLEFRLGTIMYKSFMHLNKLHISCNTYYTL